MSKLKPLILLFFIINLVSSFPDPGKWDFILKKESPHILIPKSLFADSKIFVQIVCDSPNANITIEWTLSESTCQDDSVAVTNKTHFIKYGPITKECVHNVHIQLEQYFVKESKPVEQGKSPEESESKPSTGLVSPNDKSKDPPIFKIPYDGFYTFDLLLNSNDPFIANVHIEMISTHGYLSAADWPLLPFYFIMCLVYVILGIIWLAVSFLQWRDLLRIQFWIGGVILLGMLEKAMFYAEYQNLNSNGVSTVGIVLAAEWVSCAKRTLARMLVIIVSLGFGIVKPRLGSMLHRVVGTGVLYFILASVESYLRVMQRKNETSNQSLVASIPLAVLDSAICWWIFTSLVQTTRTLRLRRNMVKLSLYRHFTNTLIFAVIASVVFMLYSIKTRRFAECLTDWKEFWVDEAFWHVLFSLLLLVIMILWRPTNNNQRYAFTPLLDNPEDEDDDDEEEQFVSDAYGVKMRGNRSASPKPSKSGTTEEDDLRWVEENIPSAIADAALPILDSDEEIISTKFEVSKMQ